MHCSIIVTLRLLGTRLLPGGAISIAAEVLESWLDERHIHAP